MDDRNEIVILSPAQGALHAESVLLSERLGLPVVSDVDPDAGPTVVLRMTDAGLQAEPRFLAGAAPLLLDFASGQLGHRVRGSGGELLIRALGGRGLQVLDGTGGLGRDAFLMARAGCRVTVCERNPAVYALLEDGLQRAARSASLADDVARIELHYADAAAFLDQTGRHYDVAYLDPMFPARSKSAQVRKEQRLLQHMAGGDTDAQELALLARRFVRRRLVVKRPKGAPELLPGAQSCIRGRKIRFDLYMPQSGQVKNAG